MSKVYVGIDVGKNGAIVWSKGPDVIGKSVIPTIGSGKGKEVDKQAIKELFKELKHPHGGYPTQLIVVLEDVHSIFGVSAGSNFQFGRVLGILEGLLEALEIPYYKVSPKTWQGICFEGVQVIEKPGTKAKGRSRYDTKAMALIAAKRLYPGLDLTKSTKAEKAHDGIVDALLMMHYAKIKL